MTRDEAIERIKARFDKWALDDEDMKAIQTLIPELRDSEDERIRMALVEYFAPPVPFTEVRGIPVQKVRDWLEKQKEQKDYNKLYEDIGKSEWFKNAYEGKSLGCDYEQKEQKPIEPSDEELQRYQNELYDFKVFATKQAKEHHISHVHDFEWNNFCAGLLSYFNEQKPAWSEEDRMLREIKRYIKEQGDKPNGLPNGTVAISDMIAWLEKQKETIHISENGMLAWLKKQEEEEGYEAIPVESTLEYKLGFKAGKESEKQKNLTTENIYKHSKERMSFYNGQKKEQKPVSNPKWAELTWKDINELERIINNVHYEFQNGIGEDSFGELVLERFKEYKNDGSMDEQKPVECERQPEFKEVEYDFRGEKVKVMRPFFRDDKGREFSTTGQDTDLTWSVLREWCEIKGITPFDLYPRAEWSEEDEEMIYSLRSFLIQAEQSGRYGSIQIAQIEQCLNWLKVLRPQYHGDVTMTEAYKMGLEAGKASSWKPSEKQTNNVIVELTRVELGDIINGLYYLKEKYYEDCKEHNGTATVGLSDEFKFYFKRFNEVLDLYTRLHELEKEKYGTTTDGYYYE